MQAPLWPKFKGVRDIDLNLDRVKNLLDLVGNPEKKLSNIIHVAGTNGKGSTIAYLRTFFESSGYSVNIYTSPHLVEFNERIRIKGELISDDYLNELSNSFEKISKSLNKQPTFFEGTTAMAIKAFAENEADFNIFETGLGGRLDATNIFAQKKTAVITNISYDHQEFLGEKITDIAKEKFGIIKEDSNAYLGKQNYEEILDFLPKAAKIHSYNDFQSEINLPKEFGFEGDHQKENFILAAKVFKDLTTKNYPENFSQKLHWPARLEKIENCHGIKEFWLDGGHNVRAAEILRDWLVKNDVKNVLIGMVQRKNYSDFVKIINSSGANLYFAEFNSDESLKLKDLDISLKENFTQTFSSLEESLSFFKQHPSSLLICGSLFLAGEIIKKYKS
jgi:dihydrofolate synthase/folylpolyglutamate synthase